MFSQIVQRASMYIAITGFSCIGYPKVSDRVLKIELQKLNNLEQCQNISKGGGVHSDQMETDSPLTLSIHQGAPHGLILGPLGFTVHNHVFLSRVMLTVF